MPRMGNDGVGFGLTERDEVREGEGEGEGDARCLEKYESASLALVC